ncbi:hypothetical protein INT43_005196 [Umbelopsis isabellina]|uniref:Uncharacterized protein n=1 Tax=Mortierella isabellina TaxID=91625 RepID=A0A8H7PIB6_MORIS|nr:hypothetical protein INT43_005196 [Umbelopsis isabellina]
MDSNLQLNLYSGLLIYRATRSPEFLLFNDSFSNKRYWGPPKGRVIGQEDEKKCALRAAFEIIGLNPKDLKIEDGFKIEVKYLSGTKPKKVCYYLAQALDAHSRIAANAEGLHIQWCNAQTATERSAFRNMQDVFKHASVFVESKKKARQQTRKRTTDSNYNPYPTSPTIPKTPSIEEADSMTNQLKGLNITPVLEPPRDTNETPVGLEGIARDKRTDGHRMSGNRFSRVMESTDPDDRAAKNRSNNPLYKTRLCERFEAEGYCPYDTKCTFAHGTEELRERTVEHTEEVVNGRTEFNDNGLFKTKLCERYMKGNFCQYGPKCNFAHGMSELKRRPSKDRNGHSEVNHHDCLPHYKPPRVENGDLRSTQDTEPKETNLGIKGIPIDKPLSPVTPIASQFDDTQQESGHGSNKVALLSAPEYTLNLVPKSPTPGANVKRPNADKLPLKTVLNGHSEDYGKTKMKVVELSAHEREIMPIVKPKSPSSPCIPQQDENVIKDLKKYFVMSTSDPNTSADVKEVTRIEMRHNFTKASLFFALFASLLDDISKDNCNTTVSIFKSREKLFSTLVRNTTDQQKFLKAWANYATKRNQQVLAKTSVVLSYWYSCDMVDEEVCLKWYNELEDDSKIKLKSAKFIDWLKTADEED